MTPFVTHSYLKYALKVDCSYIALGFVTTRCFSPSKYANYHGKHELFHFILPSPQEQFTSFISVSKVGLFIYIFLTNFACGKGQGLSFASRIYLPMLQFMVYCNKS